MSTEVASGKLEKYIQSGISLMQKEIPPTQWIVPELIPEGLTLLVGKAKMGKSFLALNIAIPISYGGMVLGTTQVEQGRVLYLTPDDPMESRFRTRIQGILGSKSMPDTFDYALQWDLIDNGGLTLLDEYLQFNQGRVKLIVIDVLNSVMPMYREDASAYQVIYNLLTPLKILAQESHISIVAIMHKNKGKEQGANPLDGIYGNTAFGAVADNILLLDTNGRERQRTLSAYGKDVKEDDIPLSFDAETGLYTISEGVKAEIYREGNIQRELVLKIAEYPGITRKELDKMFPGKESAINMGLQRNRKNGLICTHAGRWFINCEDQIEEAIANGTYDPD